MDMKLPQDLASRIKLMSLKKEVMASVLSAGVRVNDAALRKKDEDKVAALLRQVKERVGEPSQEGVSYSDLFD